MKKATLQSTASKISEPQYTHYYWKLLESVCNYISRVYNVHPTYGDLFCISCNLISLYTSSNRMWHVMNRKLREEYNFMNNWGF